MSKEGLQDGIECKGICQQAWWPERNPQNSLKLSSDLRMCAVKHVHPPLCTTQISKGAT